MEFVRSIARKVTVLHEGKVLAEGPMDADPEGPARHRGLPWGRDGRLTMLAVDAKINQFYGGSHTLWDVDLDVPAGGCVCLMGRNGVGKTTLLKVIMGLLPATSGSDQVRRTPSWPARPPEVRARAGHRLRAAGARDLRRPHRRGEPAGRAWPARRGARRCPSRSSTLFPVLKEMLRRRGGDLSGGQQQQLAIGRALALDPKLLILDEPTEGIQPNIVHEIGDVIVQLAEEGVTVLLVEQKLAFARRVGAQLLHPRPRAHAWPPATIARAHRRPGPPAPDRSEREGGTIMPNITIEAEPGAIAIDPARTAVVMIDMQRDFLEPGGFGETLGNDVSLLAPAIAPGQGAASPARASSGCWSSTPARGTAPTWPTRRPPRSSAARPSMRIGDPGPMGRILIRGEAGHDIIPELAPDARASR